MVVYRGKLDDHITVKKEVFKFAKAEWDKYKKKNEDDFDSKKEMKLGYGMYLVDCVPEALDFVIRYGHINNEEIQEVKTKIYRNLSDEKFINALTREIKEGSDIKKRVRLLPIAYKEIMQVTQAHNDSLIAANPNAQIIPMDYIVEFVQLLLKKKLKKMEKSDIPDDVAFDVLSIIPDTKVINKNPFFRMRSFMQALYVTAAKKKIDAEMFGKIVNIVFKDDDNQYENLMLYVMRERKSDFDNLKEEGQKTFWVETKKWLVEALGDMKKKDIEELLNIYIDARKADAKMQKDVERKFNFIKDADVTFGEKLTEVIEKLSKDEDKKKFLS